MAKRIYLNTPITKLGRAPAVRIASMTLRWCKRHIGVNPRKWTLPVWYIHKAPFDEEVCGEYDCWENEVYIYWDKCADVRELVETCIHEWTHQTQPIRSKYFKYPGSYSRNPYERQARYNEMKYTPVVWNEIKNKVNGKRIKDTPPLGVGISKEDKGSKRRKTKVGSSGANA